MNLKGGQQIRYSAKVMAEYARQKEKSAQEAAFSREYRSYGWSHQQNIAACKLYLNAVSFAIPVGAIASGIAGALKLGNVLAKIGSIGKLFGGGGYRMTSSAVRSALADRVDKRGFSEVGYQFQ